MSEEINKDALCQVKELMGEKFSRLVETYVTSNRENLARLHQGFEAADAQMILDSAHPMKSSAGNMGLAGLSASAQELEAQAKEVVNGTRELATLEPLIATIEKQLVAGEAVLKT